MAPWDNRLALAPTAISLLAVTELQTSLATFRPTPPVPETTPEQVEGDQDNLDDVSTEVTDPATQPQPASP